MIAVVRVVEVVGRLRILTIIRGAGLSAFMVIRIIRSIRVITLLRNIKGY